MSLLAHTVIHCAKAVAIFVEVLVYQENHIDKRDQEYAQRQGNHANLIWVEAVAIGQAIKNAKVPVRPESAETSSHQQRQHAQPDGGAAAGRKLGHGEPDSHNREGGADPGQVRALD